MRVEVGLMRVPLAPGKETAARHTKGKFVRRPRDGVDRDSEDSRKLWLSENLPFTQSILREV